MEKQTTTSERRRPRRFRHKGLVLAAASGATASLLLSLENGKIERFDFLRAAVSAGIAGLAFAQSPRVPLPPRRNRDDG